MGPTWARGRDMGVQLGSGPGRRGLPYKNDLGTHIKISKTQVKESHSVGMGKFIFLPLEVVPIIIQLGISVRK